MKKVENECAGCRDVGLTCKGASCPNRNVERFYCDRCGEEEKLYEYEDEQLCADCLLKEYNVVEGSEL